MANTALIIGGSGEARRAVAEIIDTTRLFQRKLYCADGRRAIRWLQDNAIDMICCNLTEKTRHEIKTLIQDVKDEPEWRDVPVLLFAQSEDRELLVHGLEEGASDGITFQTSGGEISAKVRWHLKNRERIQSLCQSRTQLARMALSDGLTGLYNRAYYDSTMEKEMARSLRSKKPLSLLLLDLDHFKQINDTLGHLAGDKVLAAVASVLREQSRVSDTVCRYGGEEFAIILPETPRAQAHLVAERIRRAVSTMQKELTVTVSIGINCAEKAEDLVPEALFAGADAALYAAKRNGRNRCELAEKVRGAFPDLHFVYPFNRAAATA